MLKTFFKDLFENFLASFCGRNIFWHLLAILITCVLVATGFDWFYFEHTRNFVPYMLPAALLGFVVPVFLPLILLAVGNLRKSKNIFKTAYILIQSEIVAWFVSSVYKAFTGRAHPALSGVATDISREFHFGFLKGGVFWGWPSSHTIVAFAVAATLFVLYPKSLKIKTLALLYALYVALGVSMTIHWFSDAIAGLILGIVVGIAVGRRGVLTKIK